MFLNLSELSFPSRGRPNKIYTSSKDDQICKKKKKKVYTLLPGGAEGHPPGRSGISYIP